MLAEARLSVASPQQLKSPEASHHCGLQLQMPNDINVHDVRVQIVLLQHLVCMRCDDVRAAASPGSSRCARCRPDSWSRASRAVCAAASLPACPAPSMHELLWHHALRAYAKSARPAVVTRVSGHRVESQIMDSPVMTELASPRRQLAASAASTTGQTTLCTPSEAGSRRAARLSNALLLSACP